MAVKGFYDNPQEATTPASTDLLGIQQGDTLADMKKITYENLVKPLEEAKLDKIAMPVENAIVVQNADGTLKNSNVNITDPTFDSVGADEFDTGSQVVEAAMIPSTTDEMLRLKNTQAGKVHTIMELRSPDTGDTEATLSLHTVPNGIDDWVFDLSFHNYSTFMKMVSVISHFTGENAGSWEWVSRYTDGTDYSMIERMLMKLDGQTGYLMVGENGDATARFHAKQVGYLDKPAIKAEVDSTHETQPPALHATDTTNHAQTGVLVKFSMLNATDTGVVLKLENAGTGAYINADDKFVVDKDGNITSPTIDAIKGEGYTEGSLKTHEDRLGTLEGEGEGSVEKAIDDAVSPLEADITDHEERIAQNESDIADLEGEGRTIETVKGNAEAISGHIEDTENPHEVTKTQVGLGNADNTSDANKPVSTAQQTALNLKEDKSNKVTAFQEEPTDTAYPSEKLVDTRFKVLEGTGEGSVAKAIDDALEPIDTRVTYLESVRGHLYGVRMQKSSGICIPTYDAIGLEFRPQIDTISTPSDFSSVYPWRDIKTVKVDADKNILCTIDDTSFETTVGDIMVKIPVFWHRYWTDASYEYYEISDTPRDGFFAGGFYNPDGTIRPYALVGAVKTSNYGRVPHSWVDTPFTHSLPLYSTTAGFQLDALNKSSTNKWSNIDHQAYEMVWHLIFVEIGGYVISPNTNVLGFDVKGAIGQGINGMGNSYSASNVCTVATVGANTFIMAKTRSQYFKVGMLVQIGTAHSSQNIAANRYITDISEYDATNDVITVDGATFTTTLTSTIATWAQPLPLAQLMALKNESGYVLQFGANNQSHVCYRGIWDLWGNMYEWMSGLYRYDLQFYACFDWTKMNVDDPRGVAGWVATGIAPDIANGYLKTRQVYKGALGEIGLPSAVGAGSNTWYAAYAYYFNSEYMGLRAVLCGGYWSLGVNVGFIWGGGNAPTGTGVSLGGRLIG